MKNTFTTHNYKILSMVLAIAMIFSMLPVTAFAEAAPDDDTYATSGVTISGREDDSAPETKDDLLLDGGGDETCICTAFQSDADCPVCRDDATQCFYYYCMCEALCDEDNINTECPICNEDYTSCVQAVEVPEIMPLAESGDIAGLKAAAKTGGSYSLNGDITIESTYAESGTTAGLIIESDLILDLNGHNLTITVSSSFTNGIKIATNKTLTIKDSNPDSNKLTVTHNATGGLSGNCAAINTSADSTLEIQSGTVDAKGGYGGAGIGGGGDNSGGMVIISGGKVIAQGGGSSAGIGGGSGGNGGTVTISGGTVTATCGSGGAGIGGGGNGGAGGSVTISDTANVTATGGGSGAGIGGGGSGSGNGGAGGPVTISGGKVIAQGGTNGGAGIGGGSTNVNGSQGGAGGTVTISGTADVTATGGDNGGAGIGGGSSSSGGGGGGGIVNISGGTIIAQGGNWGTGIGGGSGVSGGSGGEVEITGGKVTAKGGIGGAGIGGSSGQSGGQGGKVTIRGGTVTANGSTGGAGIGGGSGGSTLGSMVNISGGTVTAQGGSTGGAGIGGGNGGSANGSTVNISGGTVTANGSGGGAGIGNGGSMGSGTAGSLQITGGSVKINGTGGTESEAKNSDTNVYCVALTIGDPHVGDGKTVSNYKVDGMAYTYRLDGVKTIDGGKVYFYLPEHDYSISLDADGATYSNAAVEVKTDNTGAAVLTVGGAATDDSDFTIGNPGTITAGDNHDISITYAKGTTGTNLDGAIAVTVTSSNTSDGTSGQIFSGNVTFTSGSGTIAVPAEQLKKHGVTTLTVSVTGVTAPKTTSVTVIADTTASSAELTVTTQPAAPSANGGTLATQPQVTVKDKYGNTFPGGQTVTATAKGSAFTLGGTESVNTDTDGVATFTNLTAGHTAAVSGAVITFTLGGVKTVDSNTFNIPAPAPALPDAPTNVSASAGNAQATVSFTPAVTGGAAASYTVTSSPGSITATGSSSPITVTGLTNDTAYTFTVTATNAAGTSAPSAASSSVTPQATTYAVTVTGGTGSGSFAAGASVTVTANAPPSGQQFKEWTAIGLANSTYTANPLTFTMPSNDVSLTATYENIPATYSATVNPTSKTFAQADSGYGAQTAQTFTVTNTGTGEITGLSAALGGSSFEISTALSATSVTAGNTVTVSVRPKTGNAVGTHTDTLTIAGNNGISLSVGLSFTVVKSAADKVADDKAALTLDSIKGGNTTADNITVDLIQPLPSIGANGSTITWSSDNTAVIANDGTVTRPEYSASDAPVTLTATITNGTASDTQTFTLTVKKKEQKQTTVEVKPNTPQADATGLDGLFTPADETFLQNNVGASIEYRLEIEQITALPADASLVEEKLDANTQVLYLDVSLWKEIAGAGASDGSTKLDNAASPITITITLPQSLWNKDPYTIIRVHDDGSGAKAETITPTYDNTLHTLTFTTNKFSTYAIAYTQTSPPNPSDPPTSPSSNGGSSSGGNNTTATASTPPTQWVDASDAKALAESAKEQAADSVRTRSSGEAGIRKKALQTLGKSGLTYRHDTVANNAVQVRVYVDAPSKATKDILVSGYVAGARTEQINAKFGKWFTNKFKIISMDQQGDFGMKVRVAAKVDLSGMDTSNLYFYSYDKAANKYKLIVTEYRIDSKGYLHFSTVLAGDIIVSDGALTKKNKQQNADDGTYNYLAQAQLTEITNDTVDGTGMNIQPEKAQPQDFAVADSIVEAVAADGVLKLESNIVPAAITGNAAGNVNNGGVLKINLDAPNVLDAAQESGKPSVGMIAGIAIAAFFVSMILWAVIPRKDDMLLPDDER